MEKSEDLNSAPMKTESPEIYLRGENLEYYRNIEYLKEVTRQANALLDRSNAKYENILDEKKLGLVRARSISNSSKSLSPSMEGKCKKCGLSHGAAFCIVEQIMDNEKEYEYKRKSKVSKASFRDFLSIDSKTLKPEISPESAIEDTPVAELKQIWEPINVLEKLEPSQILDRYEMLCARYGSNAGRKLLLANSMANPPEERIQQWTTTDHPEKTQKITEQPQPQISDCPKTTLEYDPLCPDISQEVKDKMEQLVHIIPPCDTQPLVEHNKNWRAVFHKQPSQPGKASSIQSDRQNEEIEFDSTIPDESCQCKDQLCSCGTEKTCTAPKLKKNCSMTGHEDDYNNNYLLTMRKKIWKRQQTKRQETLILSKQNIAVVKSRTRSEEFLEKAKMEQYKTMKNCLSLSLKNEEYDHDEFNDNVQRVAELTAPSTAINHRQWDRWQEQMKEQEKLDEYDEADSLPSDAQTDDESKSLISHSTGFDYKPGGIKYSRIPHAQDIYDLIDNLYDKITRKFEKGIVKNSFKVSRLSYRPTFAFLHRKMTLLSYKSPLFQDIMYRAEFATYLKRLTPYKVRKYRKLKRLGDKGRKLVRTIRKRGMVRGLQLGKQYRKVSQSHKFSSESGYKGFKLEERTLLDPNVPNRFAMFNSLDPLGKAMTKKRIHHDFRLMCNMFEDAAKADREDLMDQGMLQRLYKFQKNLYNLQNLPHPPHTDTEDEEAHSDHTYQIPHKEEMRLLQTANDKLGHRDLIEQISYESVPHHGHMRRTKQLKAVTSNSLDKLKTTHTAARQKLKNDYGIPLKCSSSTNVKGEKSKHKETKTKFSVENSLKTEQRLNEHSEQNLQIRSSIRSLTNLLPPLKNHAKFVKNEFEETISALQNELSSLLSQPSCEPAASLTIIDNTNKTKSKPKRRLSAGTKLPELKKPSMKSCSKTNMSRISDEALPLIKQRESVENVKPGHSQELLPGRALTNKTSMLSIQSGKTKALLSRKLPLLVEKTKLGSNSSYECLSKNGKKCASDRPKMKIPNIPKQSGFKAWR